MTAFTLNGREVWQLIAYQSPHIFQLDKGMVFYAESLARGLDVRLNTQVSKVTSDRSRAIARCFIARPR